jgi:glucosamine kinase
MVLFLGVDGGGTGCRAAVADEAGRVLGQGTAGPANIATDPDRARESIVASASSALLAAGLSGDRLRELRAGLGLAGANSGGAVERLRERLPFASARIETDAVAAVKGALGPGDGIVAALGTGSVFGVQRGGAVRQIGGWGFVLGDEGSGAWIGRALCAQVLRAVDGFRPMSPLLQALLDGHGGPLGLTAFSLAARPADFAAFAPRLIGSDEPVARDILDRATADVAEAVDLLQSGQALPVVFLGGLGPTYSARLASRWPIAPAQGTALDGALWLAREGVG